jgi:porphobilinogen synthase
MRQTGWLRESVRRVTLGKEHIVCPVFVVEGRGVKREIVSMPGVYQMSVDVALEWLGARKQEGFGAYLVFGVIERGKKDVAGSPAVDEGNVVCRMVRAEKEAKLGMTAVTDLCMCEYTSHGHCGPLTKDGRVDNDATLELLVKQAINHVKAGADVIAPSGMMDGTIAALRRGLDGQGYIDTVLMSYAVKYASAFYGPFRDAADSAPEFGDRRGYQMDPMRGVDEAIMEAELDVEQGADIVMVKPAGAYLDVISAVRQRVRVPVAAYQVSGEYAMLEAAARNGWIDRKRAVVESLGAIRRAGADVIITYYAELLAGEI